MKVEIKGIEQNPIVSDYARIRVVESQSSVGNYEIRFLKAGRCGLNTNVVKTSTPPLNVVWYGGKLYEL